MERKPVPRFNQDIEFPLILYILKKNILWILAVLLILGALAFLYLRYTTPHYESATVIQLTEEQQQLNFFDEKKVSNNEIAQDIELLRSQVFIQRIIDSLPLEVTYFKEGRILDFDNYNQAPYQVRILSLSPDIYNVPIGIRFNSSTDYTLKYKIGKQKFEYNFNTRKQQKSGHFDILVNVYDSLACIKPTNPYYFVFNRSTDLMDQFSKKLKIQVQSDAARTIRINFTDVNPFRAADVANRVAKEFANFNLEKKREGVNNIISYIDNTLDHVRINLNEADSSLTSFRNQHNIVERKDDKNPADDVNSLMLQQLQQQKFEYDVDLIILDDVIKNVNQKDVDIYEILTQVSKLKPDAYVLSIVNNLQVLITSRREIKKFKTDEHPDVIAINEEIENQKQLLLRSLESIRASTKTTIGELKLDIGKLEGSLYLANGNLPNQVEYMQKKRYFEVNQTYYDLLIQKRVEYDLLSKGYTSGYRVLQFSTPAKSPIYPRKVIVVFGVFGLWLLVAFIGLALSYLAYDRILAVEHITKYCGVPVLGTVTRYKSDIPVSQLVVDKKPKSLIAESFRNIRSNLDFISNKPGAKLIAVTSTISGEGKTFVSINLAGILAFTGKKVIIIDADMRKPKIHVGFGVTNEKGLSNLLIGKNTLEESILKSNMEGLDFITAGPIPPNPSELLLSNEMNLLIERLQQDYEYVLIDNPPIGIVTDAMTLLHKADYPIYVFRAGVSRKFFINSLQKLVFDNKVQNLSIVLNGVEHKKGSSYGYGNYGYTSSGYGYYDDDHRKKKKKSPFSKK